MRILVAEDDPRENQLVCRGLKDLLFIPDSTLTAQDTLKKLRAVKYDLAIFDRVFSGESLDGIELAQEARERHPRMPIILLTAKTAAGQLEEGLSSGATVYLKKPFLLAEAMSYVKALARNAKNQSVNKTIETKTLRNGSLALELFSYDVTLAGNPLTIRNKEFQILRCLMLRAGEVVSRDDLIAQIWGDSETLVSDNSIDVYVNKLRKQLGDYGRQNLITVRGVGHKLKKLAD